MGISKRPAKRAPAGQRSPMVDPADVRAIIGELTRTLAPADVNQLLERTYDLRHRAQAMTGPKLDLLRAQVELALDCLRDHAEGRASQIPYQTIAALAAGVSYFAEALDIIPDFLPRIGRLDDALAMAVAFELAEAGVRRYCDWSGRDASRYYSARR